MMLGCNLQPVGSLFAYTWDPNRYYQMYFQIFWPDQERVKKNDIWLFDQILKSRSIRQHLNTLSYRSVPLVKL